MTGSQKGSVIGDRRQSEVGSVVSYATAITNASRCTPQTTQDAALHTVLTNKSKCFH